MQASFPLRKRLAEQHFPHSANKLDRSGQTSRGPKPPGSAKAPPTPLDGIRPTDPASPTLGTQTLTLPNSLSYTHGGGACRRSGHGFGRARASASEKVASIPSILNIHSDRGQIDRRGQTPFKYRPSPNADVIESGLTPFQLQPQRKGSDAYLHLVLKEIAQP
jgi:hypothetical protein